MVHEKVFELGECVEVSPDDAGFRGSWYEAKIITVPRKFMKNIPRKQQQEYYDVEYKTLLEDQDESVLLSERIRADRIRPLPPPRGDQPVVVKVGDVVEAFHSDGWWVGTVTEVLEGSGRVRMTFEYPPDKIECGIEDLRLHLEWKNGVWSPPQEANKPETEETISEIRKRERKSLASLDHIKRPSKYRKKDSVSPSFGDRTFNRDPTNGEKDVKGTKEACINKKKDGISGSNQQRPTNSTTGSIFRPRRKCHSDDSVNRKRDIQGSKETLRNKTLGIGEDANAHSAPPNVDSGRSPTRKVSESLDKETWDRAVARTVLSIGNGSKSINYSQEQKVVEQPEIMEEINKKVISSDQEKENLKQTSGVEETENETSVQESEVVHQAATVERNSDEVLGNENEIPTPTKEMEMVDEAVAVEDNGNKLANQSQEMEIVVAHAGEAVNVVDDQNWPFVKTSPLWNVIASMQVFQAIPQRPHFRALADKHPVQFREGKAIRYMSDFHEIVKNTIDSKLDEPRKSIVERLERLPKLEKNGFEVKRIRDHLTALLEGKEELSTLENQLEEHNKEKKKIVEEIDELDEKIKEMQEKRSEAMSEREKVDGEIADFESKAEALRRSLEENAVEFEQLTGAPW